MIYLQLFWEFFKTGLFAVGGGMATIPFLYEISDKTGWFTHADLEIMIAVSECTPGPVGINMATYVGFITGTLQNGTPGAILGAVIATLGLITPSIIVILIIASLLKGFKDNKYVKSAFYGLRSASTGLIAAAAFGIVVSNLFIGESIGFDVLNWKGIILAAVLFLLTDKVKSTKKLHPIVFIAASAVMGILLGM